METRKDFLKRTLPCMMMLTGCGGQSKENGRMSMLEIAEKRHAVRTFLPKEVEQSKLDYILNCMRLAPSAGNIQPWRFYIAKSEAAREAVLQSYTIGNIKGKPMFIVACGDASAAWKRPSDGRNYMPVDVAIATEHLVLAATEQGLSTCWLGHFDPRKMSDVLQIPSMLTPIAVIAIGYSEPDRKSRTGRKALEEITKII